MVPVLLVSVTPFVGKNVVALGIAEKFRRGGKSVGYFKPIGPLVVPVGGRLVDEDAVFFGKVLQLSDSLESLCPLVLSDQTLADTLRGSLRDARERILAAFRAVSQGKDLVLAISMGRLSCGLALGYPMDKFADDVNARVIVVARYKWPMETLDGILHVKALLPGRFAGVVFNRVPASQASQIERAVKPYLQARGVDVLGMAPEDTTLDAVPVSELVEALEGKVLCAGDKLDQLAEHFSIGAMNADAALRFFRRVPNKAVITGGDRADIQLAALQTSTHCLILTGDLYPNERILTRAEELGVPVVLVTQDTSTTAEICEQLRGHLSLQSERKINRVIELMDECMDWDLLRKGIGIQ
jgi:hypothetical protein